MEQIKKMDLLRRVKALQDFILSNAAFPDYTNTFAEWGTRIARETASDNLRENPILRESAEYIRQSVKAVNKELLERRGMEKHERDLILERRNLLLLFAAYLNPMEDSLADIEQEVAATEQKYANVIR